MKKFCSSLRQHASNVINFETKKMLLLTKKEVKSHQDTTVCCICGKKLRDNLLKIKIIEKLETIAILQLNTEVQHIV